MAKSKKPENWTFSRLNKDGKWEKFTSDPKLRARLRNAIEDYDVNCALNREDGRDNEHNREFERNVLIDHIEEILEYHFTHDKS